MPELIPYEEIRLSNTSMNKHRKCPQAWSYDFARRLERIEGEVHAPLDFGNWWHAIRAAEAIVRGRELGTLRYCPEALKTAVEDAEISTDSDTLVEDVWRAIGRWWNGLSDTHKDLWVADLGDTAPERLRYVDERWKVRYKKEIPTEEPVAVEMPWERHLPHLAGRREAPVKPMNGVLDMLYFDRKRGMLVLRDAKSHRQLSSYSQVDEMLDSQIQVYAWAAAPLVKEWGLGSIRAIQYDRVRMTAPKSPEVTASGNLSKGVTDYDAFTYRKWAMTDTRPSDDELVALVEEKYPDDPEMQSRVVVAVDEVLNEPGRVWGKVGEFYVSGAKKGEPKFGLYHPEEKVLLELMAPDAVATWFRRTLTPLNKNIVASHLRAMTDTALQSEDTYAALKRDGEAPRNFGRACSWCDYSALCKAEMVGGSSGEYDLESMNLRVRPKKA